MNSKKIIIIGPSFFNYLHAIEKQIKESGIECKNIIERGNESLFKKVIYRSSFLKFLFYPLVKKRHKEIILECVNFKATHALFISPESMTSSLLELLKNHNIEPILYMWDGFENKPAAKRFIKNFSFTATFDPIDAKKYQMELIHLFAEDVFFISNTNNRAFDFSFVGTAHSIRPKFILELIKKSNKDKLNNMIHLYRGNIFYHIMGLLRTGFSDTKMFTNNSISKNKTAEYFKKSKYVLDITHPKQKGLTSRTFEAISSGAILITNNQNARRLIPDFKDRIIVYSDIKSLETNRLNFTEIIFSEEQLYNLSLKRFCDEIINLTMNKDTHEAR